MEVKRNQVHTVKIYFIEPVDIISVVIDTLVKLEFETYTVSSLDKEKLLTLLHQDIRSVIFLSITNEKELEKAKVYIDALNEIKDSSVQTGAFVKSNIKPELKMELLERNTAVIEFQDIKENTVAVLRKILTYFEARGTRKFVRTKTTGQSEAYFTVKNLENPLKARVMNVSSHAFLCMITKEDLPYFTPGSYFHEVLLVLKGIRLRTSVKIIGFNKDMPTVFVMKLCTAKLINSQLHYTDHIPPEIKNKMHNYIKICLKDNLNQKLREIKE